MVVKLLHLDIAPSNKWVLEDTEIRIIHDPRTLKIYHIFYQNFLSMVPVFFFISCWTIVKIHTEVLHHFTVRYLILPLVRCIFDTCTLTPTCIHVFDLNQPYKLSLKLY